MADEFWNPLNIAKADKSCTIYCTLGWTVHHLNELLNSPNTDKMVLYYLTLFLDMHIPLMIHIEDENQYTDEYLLTDYGEGAPIEKYLPGIDKVYHQGICQTYYITLSGVRSSVTLEVTNPIVHLIKKSSTTVYYT